MRCNRILKFLILNLNFAFLILNFNLSAHAWQFPMEVAAFRDNGEKVYNKLIAGIESGATDSFDNLWDTPALLSHPDDDSSLALRAYFIPQGGGGEAEKARLWKDIRGMTKGNTTWEITIDSVPAGKIVVVSWELPPGLLKAGERLVLKDDEAGADGQPIHTDVTQTSSYALISDSDKPKSLSLVYSKESTKSSGSGSGSAFGCGTIRGTHEGGPSDDGTAIPGIIVLFSPWIYIKLLRRLRSCQ